MKYAIRYYSKTGNTKKLADSISDVIGIDALGVDAPLTEDIDILFLGSSIYGSSIDPAIINFFNNIDVNIGKIVSFSSSGIGDSTYDEIVKLCSIHNILIDENNFHCIGSFAGMNKNKPNDNDLLNIKSFTKLFL